MKNRLMSWGVALLIGVACAATQPRVNPEDSTHEHRADANEHEAATEVLARFEAAECGELPARSRAACPSFGPVAKIADVPWGVRVTFAPGTRVDAVVAHMRCHYAFVRAHGFDARVSCPLYMPGLHIQQAGKLTVQLEAPDRRHVEELRSRSREEAIYERTGRAP